MQHPSFESLISAPWPEPEENAPTGEAYHLNNHKIQSNEQTSEDESLEHTVILGYN